VHQINIGRARPQGAPVPLYHRSLMMDEIHSSIGSRVSCEILNGADGFSDIEHVALGSRRIDGQAAEGRGAELGKRSINTPRASGFSDFRPVNLSLNHQRLRRGYETGDLRQGDTFNTPDL
jgi:hypothetical protein